MPLPDLRLASSLWMIERLFYTFASLGIALPEIGQHAAYLSHWIEAMKADPRYIFAAASKAQQAAEFLQGLQPKPE